MSDIFARLYEVHDGDRQPFGNHWCGPDVLPRDPVLVAIYEPDEDSDGLRCEVWAAAVPARFYQLRFGGVVLGTGSDNRMAGWAAETAELVAGGMVGP